MHRVLSQKVRIVLSLVVLLAGFALVPAVSAQDFEGVCQGVQLTGDRCDPEGQAQAENTVNNVIENVLQILSGVVGVVAVIMLIYGGFRYVTAGGDSGKVSSAQQTIIYAIVGLIIVALAQMLVRFVLRQAVTT